MQHDPLPILQAQRNYFNSGATRSYTFRKQQLLALKECIVRYEQQIYDALHSDLKKSKEDCWVTENGFTLSEINYILRHLKNWMQPERITTNLLNFPSKSRIIAEPLGVTLIISPWNYPFQLLLAPLAGAIAAGNCVVLKPSEHVPATSALLGKMISETFAPEYISLCQGDGAAIIPAMMNNFAFDHVFYTGSTKTGKLIYEMAAKQLTPVTLELGGKSPCIVEADADIAVAAKRIAVTKFNNCGQMCVAPDYILVHESKREALIAALSTTITSFFGEDASQSDSYGKIINEEQFDRLISYLQDGQILYGGNYSRNELFIAPTLLSVNNMNAAVMQEEIFGPILPVISFTQREEALHIIQQHAQPLAFYVFTSSSDAENYWLQSVSFGGGCINNAAWHLTNPNLPFGGRGNSGMGAYHGKYSFQTFSHRKAILKTPTWFDPSVKYPPFTGKLKWFKKLIG